MIPATYEPSHPSAPIPRDALLFKRWRPWFQAGSYRILDTAIPFSLRIKILIRGLLRPPIFLIILKDYWGIIGLLGSMMRKFLAVFASFLVLTSCSTYESSVETTPSVAAAITSPSATETFSEDEEVAEYAIALLDIRQDLEDKLNEWDSSNCSGISVTYRDDVICKLNVSIIGTTGSVASMQAAGLTKPGHPEYIGTAPEQIRNNLANIVKLGDHADELKKTYYNGSCGDKYECANTIESMIYSARQIIQELEAIELRS